ncbi:MAG TPA: hypothetical protein VLT81_06470 [Chondromyces sp.]|nr:hypothetical protein [Chondromyces sp.]
MGGLEQRRHRPRGVADHRHAAHAARRARDDLDREDRTDSAKAQRELEAAPR